MDTEPGDDYVRRTATFIRTHEQSLAHFGAKSNNTASFMSWVGLESTTRPMILSMDTHHLYYLLMRLEALDLPVGSLDIKVDNPSRPMNYIVIPGADRADAMSISSFRSTFSAVSKLSLGPQWWGRAELPPPEMELKYIYSSFTKLPALSLHGPGRKVISELANDSPIDTALPLQSFKLLQYLECVDIDPRILLGWDFLAESLRSLTIKRSGIEDVSDIFVDAVVDDQLRRETPNSRPRRRRLLHATARSLSKYSSRKHATESVPEEDEESTSAVVASATAEDVRPLSPTPSLSRLKWAFLKHLCLADNALTFFPATPIPHLVSLTHLDLSSNLLVSVPPGLSGLYNLVSLNLADNTIDSVLGIYQNLGQIYTLDLSHNRLDSICGLERLGALERVDLRHNYIEESAEIGRLATLPNITHVSVEGNPFVEDEQEYRLKCFELFIREGKEVFLDGTPPSFYEKRKLSIPTTRSPPPRPVSAAYSPPVLAVRSGSQAKPMQPSAADPTSNLPSPPSPAGPSPALAATSSSQIRPRRRKAKRIVNLDGTEDKGGVSSDPENTDVVIPAMSKPVSHQQSAMARSPARHSRYRTEFSAAEQEEERDPPPNPISRHATVSMSMSRSQKRRNRVSASVFEPSSVEEDGTNNAEAFRTRVEALRAEVGDNWLKALNQSQFSSRTSTPSEPLR